MHDDDDGDEDDDAFRATGDPLCAPLLFLLFPSAVRVISLYREGFLLFLRDTQRTT